MSIFAIGDIHGEREKLEKLLAVLPRTDADTTVFLGDALDRGPDCAGVVRRLMAEYDAAPDRTILLWGNHEDMAASHFNHPAAPQSCEYDIYDWFKNGAFETLASYGLYKPECFLADCPSELDHYFSLLRLFWRDTDGTVYVHVGVAPWSMPEETDVQTLLWTRSYLTIPQPEGRLLVHGHTPYPVPDIGKNRIGVDTGACRGGTLTAVQLPERIFHQAR